MTEDEFYSKIDTWIQADIETWTHITLLAYFCKKYETKNKIKFRLVRAKKGPTMGKEAADFAKLFRTLAPENYKDLSAESKKLIKKEINTKIYNYINWMFDYKFRSGQQSVNGTKLFLLPSIIVEFERMYSAYLKQNSESSAMNELLSFCNKNFPDIFNHHQIERKEDLLMLKRYADMYELNNDSMEKIVLGKAKEIGLL